MIRSLRSGGRNGMCWLRIDGRDAAGDTGDMRGARWTWCLLLLAALSACHSESNAGDGGRGAGSGSGTGGAGAPLPPRAPGGDTSDLGASGRGCWGDDTDSERVSLEEARARGFDPDAVLAPIEGVFEADVRWLQLSRQPKSHVRLELTPAGTVTVVGWDCRHEAGRTCYAGNHLLVDVRAAVSTDDGRLRGSFVTTLDPTPVKGLNGNESWAGAFQRFGEAGEVLVGFGGDASSVLGSLELPKPDPMTTPSVSFELLIRPDDDARVSIRFLVADASQGGHAIDGWPLDGCRVNEGVTPTADSCPQPTRRVGIARFGDGFCCASSTAFPDLPYPIALGTDRACLDADGGMLTFDSDGGVVSAFRDGGTN